MRRILSLDLVLVLAFAMAFVLGACTLLKPPFLTQRDGSRETTSSRNTTTTIAATDTSSPEIDPKPDAVPAQTLSPYSAPLHTPQKGDPERKAILDALRMQVQADLHQDVVFEVTQLSVMQGWAFMRGRPVKPSGDSIDYSRTKYAEDVATGAFDDSVSALMRYTDGSWGVLTYNIGATDVVWSPWASDYGAPTAIFP